MESVCITFSVSHVLFSQSLSLLSLCLSVCVCVCLCVCVVWLCVQQVHLSNSMKDKVPPNCAPPGPRG